MATRRTRIALLVTILALVVAVLILLADWGIVPPPRHFTVGDREFLVYCRDRDTADRLEVTFFSRLPWLLEPVPYDPAAEASGVVVAVVTAPGCAGEVVPVDHGSASLTEGEAVEGLVLDLYGEPIAGARVSHPHQPPYLAETRTDEAGRFRFERIASDGWVRAEADGYAPLDLSLSLFPEVGRDLVFYLVRGKRVSGRVVDSDGRGVSRALVSLDQESITRILADEEGRFTLDAALSDWEVLLQAHAEGFVGPVENVLVGETGIELPLYRPAEIRGRVVHGGTGEPVEEFELRKIDGEVLPDGVFLAKSLLPGKHRIEVRAGSRRGEAVVEVREGEVRTGVTIPVHPPRWAAPKDFRLAHPVEFEVAVAGIGMPAAGARIRGERRGEEVKTDRFGRAAVLLPPGEHRIRVGSAIGAFAEQTVFVIAPTEEPVSVSVTPNQAAWLSFQDGVPEPRSKVWLRADDKVEEQEFSGNTVRFNADREAPISVYAKARGYLPARLEDVLVPESGYLEIELPAGAFIKGRCLGSGGHPLAKVVAEVQEKPLDARMETLGDGVFRAGALEPGSYRFLLYARNVRTRTYDLAVPAEGVDLGDVQMLPPCDLHIAVVTSRGAPVPDALVETSILVAAKGATDATGRVVLPGTNPEEMLRVSAPGYVDTWHEVRVPDEAVDLPVTVTLYRPARLILHTVDSAGRPVEIAHSDGPDLQRLGPGTYGVKGLSPGPVEMTLTDREGREGVVQTVLAEGEERVERVVIR